MAGNVLHQAQLATVALHHRRLGQCLAGIIAALHVHIGLYIMDQRDGVILAEGDHEIHAGQTRQHPAALDQRVDRAGQALYAPDALIRVDPDDQDIPKRFCLV